jgi:hypothetical protein
MLKVTKAAGAPRAEDLGPGPAEPRLELIARDPQSLFAYWELPSASLTRLRREVGARMVAVSSVSLRVRDEQGSWTHGSFVPQSQRSCYVPLEGRVGSCRAEIGLMLPTGVYHRLATSPAVTPPRRAEEPAPTAAKTTTWAEARRLSPEEGRRALELPLPERPAAAQSVPRAAAPRRPGASDAFRGASDLLHR